LALRPPIRAAGGVVQRRGERGAEILLVHRPRYDDWSLPKGKAQNGESDEECALREVKEETGLECSLGLELPSVSYRSKGRPKRVRYWLMLPLAGEFSPHDEIDEVAWLDLAAARARFTYEHDRLFIEAVVRLV
jgi:8-oxo-dGTP pyrophosphatase MutT (NUDIX family)